jgi:ubiquinone/menaquinone biosynthesis C-methylase UbiE
MSVDRYQEVIKANIAVHSRLASVYASTEPHFRPENVAVVEGRIKQAVAETGATSILDLGCGTGFVINIARRHVPRVVGVDVTRAMLDQVDAGGGGGQVELHEHDTGSFPVEAGSFGVVTAYSFLHHLYDIEPTLTTAARALKEGGQLYVDLEPNFYFWDAVEHLEGKGTYDPIVQREIDHVAHKDEEVQRDYGISKEVFNDAEYGKNVAGGFREEQLRELLLKVGFARVEFRYYWFLGQAFMVNDQSVPREEALRAAERTDAILQRAMPLSRNLYKYLGFIAYK